MKKKVLIYKNEKRFQRENILNKLKNNSFYEQKMKDLSSKLDLLNNLKNEVKSD